MNPSNRQRALEAAWFGRPGGAGSVVDPDPLEPIREAVQAMEAGDPIPMASARVLVRALRAYLDGTELDITRALGLRPRRGGAAEVPVRLARRRARDDLLGLAFRALPGNDTNRAERLAQLLSAPPSPDVITEADLFACIERLHAEHGGDLPSSGRQILRVVKGETTTGRR